MLRMVLMGLLGSVILSGMLLVFLYNRTVNLQHAVSSAEKDIKTMQTESAELQDRIYAVFASAHVEAFAAEHGLVKDKTPQYLTVDPRWFLASRY